MPASTASFYLQAARPTRACVGVLLLSMLFVASPAAAASTLPIQGVVRDNAAALVTDGAFAMSFALYSAADAETPLWTEAWPPGAESCDPDPGPGCVTVSGGVFTVLLGTYEALVPETLASADQLYLGITVEAEPELPRRPLGAAARALTAAHADVAGSVVCSGCIPASALDFDVCEAASSCGAGGPVAAGDLPADGLDEISNGNLTNQLERAWGADGLPVPIGLTASASIEVEAAGVLESVSVSVTLTHPGATDLRLELAPPGGGAPITLAAQGTFTGPEVSGVWTESDELQELLGTSPAGTWTVSATDEVENGNEANAVNALTAFSIELEYLAESVTKVSGDLLLSGELSCEHCIASAALSQDKPLDVALGSQLTAGESIGVGETVFMASGGEAYAGATAKGQDGNTILECQSSVVVAQTFFAGPTAVAVTAVDLTVLNAAQAGLTVSLFETVGGVPTVELQTVSVSWYSTEFTLQTFAFDPPVQVAAEQHYAIVAHRPGGCGGHIKWLMTDGNPYPGGTKWAGPGTNGPWTQDTGRDMWFQIWESERGAGLIYRASASTSGEQVDQWLGFASADAESGQAVAVDMLGVTRSLTALSPGSRYYLANSAGGISTQPGIVSRSVGIALSAGTLLIDR